MDFKSPKFILLYKILAMLANCITAFGVFVFCAIYISFGNKYAEFYNTMVAIILILALGVIGCAIWKVLSKKSVYIPFICAFGICFAVIVCFSSYTAHIDAIPTVGEIDNYTMLRKYSPYDNNDKVAVLDSESTLKITENFPLLDGATAMYPMYSAFVKAVYPPLEGDEAISSLYTGDRIRCSTTSGAYTHIVDSAKYAGEDFAVDIIFVGAPSVAQAKYAEENGVKLIYTPIGYEAFVFFVNSENPIDNITVEQIQDIYSGKITKWSQLGVEGMGDIKAFQREEGSGSQSALVRLMNGKELINPPKEDIIDGMGGIITKTADYKNHKNSIGYSFRFYSTEMVSNNQIKLLKIDGVEPTPENIKNGTYPIFSNFYAVTRAERDSNTEKLVNWILSEQGQELIEKTGYAPLR